jgi:hypothetical protein
MRACCWLLTFLCSSSIASSSALAAPPKPPAALVKLSEARVAAAMTRIQMAEVMYTHGTGTLDALVAAYKSWWLATRETPGDVKLVDAARTYRDMVTKMVELVDKRYAAGMASQADQAAARYELAEAEFWLADARWKAGEKLE